MQGHIHVVSELNQGSEFFFTVVLTPIESSILEHNVIQSSTNSGSNQRLLLVEDNPINLNLAREILVTNGYEVLEAENGKIALEILEREPVSAVLMDLRMPVMSGNEAIKHIRANEKLKGLPVIALSAGVLQHEIDEAMANGFDQYITKPVDFNRLQQALNQLGKTNKASTADHPSELPPTTNQTFMVRGVNFGVALKNHDGDEELLFRLLHDFVDFYEKAPAQLSEALQIGDLEAAIRLTHNLAGLAGTFGAEKLMSICREAEKALLHDGTMPERLLTGFNEEMQNLIEAIFELQQLNEPLSLSR